MNVAAIYQAHPAVVDFINGQSRLICQQLEMIATLRRESFAFETEKLAAEQYASQLEAQLAACDAERQELRAALGMAKAELAVAKLPASSRDNVIQLVREAA